MYNKMKAHTKMLPNTFSNTSLISSTPSQRSVLKIEHSNSLAIQMLSEEKVFERKNFDISQSVLQLNSHTTGTTPLNDTTFYKKIDKHTQIRWENSAPDPSDFFRKKLLLFNENLQSKIWESHGYVDVDYNEDPNLSKKVVRVHTGGGGNIGIAGILYPIALEYIKTLDFDLLNMGPAGGAASKTVIAMLSQKIGERTSFRAASIARDNRLSAQSPQYPTPEMIGDSDSQLNIWDMNMDEEHKHHLTSLQNSPYRGLAFHSELVPIVSPNKPTQQEIEIMLTDVTSKIDQNKTLKDYIIENRLSRLQNLKVILDNKPDVPTLKTIVKDISRITHTPFECSLTDSPVTENNKSVISAEIDSRVNKMTSSRSNMNLQINRLRERLTALRNKQTFADSDFLDLQIINMDFSHITQLPDRGYPEITIQGDALNVLLNRNQAPRS